MNHRFINSISKDRSEASIYLYGVIGEEINGNQFASELRYLDREVELVKLHINSAGGSVHDGLSIVGTIRGMITPVAVYIDGVASSMAAVIAVCGDTIHMRDYSMMMIHDPYFSITNISVKAQRALTRYKTMMVKILSARGKTEEEISRLMTEETWFSAEEALEHKLCDEIIASPTGGYKNLSPDEILSRINNLHIKKEEKMKLTTEVAKVLNIAEEPSNDALSGAILKLSQERTAALEAKNSAEQALQSIQAAQKEIQTKEAETLIDSAIRSGRINAEAKEAYAKFFGTDFKNAKTALEAIPERKSVVGQLQDGEAQDKLLALSWDEAFRSSKLEEIQDKHPEHFAKLKKSQFEK